MLELRAARLAGTVGPEAVRAVESPPPGSLARALQLELLLDHLVLVGERLPALDAGLAKLGRGAPGGEAERDPPLAALEELVLERAQGLGLAPPDRPGAPAGPTPVGARGFGRALAALLGPASGGWATWDR